MSGDSDVKRAAVPAFETRASLRVRITAAIRDAMSDTFPAVLIPLIAGYATGCRAVVIPCVCKYPARVEDGTPDNLSSLYYWTSNGDVPSFAPATEHDMYESSALCLQKDLGLNDDGGRLYRLSNGCTGYAVDDGVQVFGPVLAAATGAISAANAKEVEADASESAAPAAVETVRYGFRYLIPSVDADPFRAIVHQITDVTPAPHVLRSLTAARKRIANYNKRNKSQLPEPKQMPDDREPVAGGVGVQFVLAAAAELTLWLIPARTVPGVDAVPEAAVPDGVDSGSDWYRPSAGPNPIKCSAVLVPGSRFGDGPDSPRDSKYATPPRRAPAHNFLCEPTAGADHSPAPAPASSTGASSVGNCEYEEDAGTGAGGFDGSFLVLPPTPVVPEAGGGGSGDPFRGSHESHVIVTHRQNGFTVSTIDWLTRQLICAAPTDGAGGGGGGGRGFVYAPTEMYRHPLCRSALPPVRQPVVGPVVLASSAVSSLVAMLEESAYKDGRYFITAVLLLRINHTVPASHTAARFKVWRVALREPIRYASSTSALFVVPPKRDREGGAEEKNVIRLAVITTVLHTINLIVPPTAAAAAAALPSPTSTTPAATAAATTTATTFVVPAAATNPAALASASTSTSTSSVTGAAARRAAAKASSDTKLSPQYVASEARAALAAAGAPFAIAAVSVYPKAYERRITFLDGGRYFVDASSGGHNSGQAGLRVVRTYDWVRVCNLQYTIARSITKELPPGLILYPVRELSDGRVVLKPLRSMAPAAFISRLPLLQIPEIAERINALPDVPAPNVELNGADAADPDATTATATAVTAAVAAAEAVPTITISIAAVLRTPANVRRLELAEFMY